MAKDSFISPDLIRAKFSAAMSAMYQTEVPLYGDLMRLVAEVNEETLRENPALKAQLVQTDELARLDEERHGAIRLGTADELHTMRRLFAVMGMVPVGYYDLTPAGVPVHSTAFRAIHEDSLRVSPFRVFTSLLRLELIEDPVLREEIVEILEARQIFSDEALRLIEKCEANGGLNADDADNFVTEVLKTFSWHQESTVTKAQYQLLHDQHRLIADVVAFKGPHINHLTPRTLDIDRVQNLMPQKGITPKAVIEGPPTRKCPILLRQTSFKALSEKVRFIDQALGEDAGSHTARFGEIEQRGVALTPKGRMLYDELLNKTRQEMNGAPNESNSDRYYELLAKNFMAFPDSYEELHDQALAYFAYYPTTAGKEKAGSFNTNEINVLVAEGALLYEPIVYEDFLPVSAAGIFQSNLGEGGQAEYEVDSNQAQFEEALGAKVFNELKLYAETSTRTLMQAKEALKIV
ncbi:VOC family protein [Ignatzschineria rhizosphaerae]|uniref:2-oxoadipate dioxygenase/decarboxylase n=1 Tax=Ignatzschineria rhizosphaerae TaxID=2923279 RepID=A0ABY3X475_9GAMM|nr:VOC family protein [Ignatzschineria rhizosphaerae]UNM96257.1 VOC family protein [Ignatzschineria rhizosphaerae]